MGFNKIVFLTEYHKVMNPVCKLNPGFVSLISSRVNSPLDQH
jgi:hypothetical protein